MPDSNIAPETGCSKSLWFTSFSPGKFLDSALK